MGVSIGDHAPMPAPGMTSAGQVRSAVWGRGMPLCRQIGTFRRWSVVNRRRQSPFARTKGELPLSKPIGSVIPIPIPWASGECRPISVQPSP